MPGTKLADPRYPGRLYAWYTVVLLTIAYVLSFVDIYILALLVEPVKASLALTDTQIGLLLGVAFAALYAAFGLPIGWLADRYRRTWIVGAGIALWSLATAASGLAHSFGQLAAARLLVGLGDATLAPCALSLIADSFPANRRGRPIAFYIGAQAVGAGIAALAGGAVMGWARAQPSLVLPLVGTVATWQISFVAVGLPGLAVALLLVCLREPARHEAANVTSIAMTLRYLGGRLATFASLFAVVCVMTIIAYSQNWFAAMFARTWHWDPGDFAVRSGVALLLVGPLVVNATGWLSDRLVANGRRDGPLLLVLAGTLWLVPTATLAPLMPGGAAAFIVWLASLIGLSTISAAAPIALLAITPGEIRAQVTAFFYLVISLAGLVIGPLAVGVLNDSVFGEAGVRYSCAAVALLIGLPGAALVGFLRRCYVGELLSIDRAPQT